MSETSRKKTEKIQSLKQAFESINNNTHWLPRTQFVKEMVRAIGILDSKITDVGNAMNHNAELLNKIVKQLDMELQNEQPEDSVLNQKSTQSKDASETSEDISADS